jgi:transmembrane sensor
LAKNIHIKDLLNKFSQGNLSREELDFVYQSLSNELHTDEIKTWLYNHWEDAADTNPGLKSDEILKTLIRKLNLSESDKGEFAYSETQVKSNLHALFISMLKYAAILIIGFMVAWLLRGRVVHQNYKPAMVLNELSIPMGSKSKITLSDGTKVWLNSGSTLKYPSVFLANKREIYLEGEAYFDVTHDKERPFIVNTSEIHIKVLGTKFNVKSYPDENLIETTLVSGSIEIEAKQQGEKTKRLLRLEPNQKATFSRTTNNLLLTEITEPEKIEPLPVGNIHVAREVNTEIVTSWKDNKLVFNRERFENIATRLERWYDVHIIIEDSTLKEYRYTGTFEKETLEQALYALKLASPFEYTIDKNNILIYKSNR